MTPDTDVFKVNFELQENTSDTKENIYYSFGTFSYFSMKNVFCVHIGYDAILLQCFEVTVFRTTCMSFRVSFCSCVFQSF